MQSTRIFYVFWRQKLISEKLFAIRGFEEWANANGFTQIICYWAAHEGKAAYGGEGILIFSKVACEVSLGIGEPEFDRQARVLTLNFPEILMVISYNPQGGLREESLNFRARWEKSFFEIPREE